MAGKVLQSFFLNGSVEAGCDEAGRGCLAGPVVAAAVILPADFSNSEINDSKQLSEKKRIRLRDVILREAIDYSVGIVSNTEIDAINILNASIKAMHLALDDLSSDFNHIIVDGNRFKPYRQTPYKTIVKGDALYYSIAAASILAKTYRDEVMEQLATEFPEYGWLVNKGYPTKHHREAILEFGVTPYHRRSFRLIDPQYTLDF